MGKIKLLLSKNKREVIIVSASLVVTYISGIYLGRKIEGYKWSESLVMLGDTGLQPNKIIGDNKYTISVLKETLE